MAKYTKESILETLRNLSSNLGRTKLSRKDIASVISPSNVKYHFGNLRNALSLAGLEVADNIPSKKNKLSDDELFSALFEV